MAAYGLAGLALLLPLIGILVRSGAVVEQATAMWATLPTRYERVRRWLS